MANKLAWLTPDSNLLTNPLACRCIEVPADLWYLVNGALWLLTDPTNWEQHGTATPAEMADYFFDVWEHYTMSTCAELGELRPFVISTLPDRWLAMDGATHQRVDYPELASVIPVSWQGNNNFTLPDMTGHSVVGQGTVNGMNYATGDTGGESEHRLTTPELPSHTHGYIPPVLNIDLEGPGVPDIFAAGLGPMTQTAPTGGNQPHNNMPPFVAVRWAIYAGR